MRDARCEMRDGRGSGIFKLGGLSGGRGIKGLGWAVGWVGMEMGVSGGADWIDGRGGGEG